MAAHTRKFLAFSAALWLWACTAQAGEVLQAEQVSGRGRQLLADSCASQGLQGTCVGSCCCCYSGGAGIVEYKPNADCTCARVINTSQIWATVILAIILVLGGLLLQLYFGGSLPVSPYPGQQQRQRGGRGPQQQGQHSMGPY